MAEPQRVEELVLLAQHAAHETQRRLLFNEVVGHYQTWAYQYAYTMLGDTQLAQDATQEAFLTAYQQLMQLRAPQAFTVWLQRILYTHCCRMGKQDKALIIALELSDEVVAYDQSPQATLEQWELQEMMHRAIASLPESQQTPVTLYYLEDYSQLEIAQALNLSLAAVKKRLERARTLMGERMQEMAHAQGIQANLFATLMEHAAEDWQMTLLETLLLEGMEIDEQDGSGKTVLHWAAQEGHLEAVDLLLRYRADVTTRDHGGRTALQVAVESSQRTIAKRLGHHSSPR